MRPRSQGRWGEALRHALFLLLSEGSTHLWKLFISWHYIIVKGRQPDRKWRQVVILEIIFNTIVKIPILRSFKWWFLPKDDGCLKRLILILHDKYFSRDSRSIHEIYCLLASSAQLQTNILWENDILFVFARLLYTLEFCRCRDERVYVNVGVVGNVLLGVFEGSIHPLSWTSWHRTLCTMQCWALNVVANCKTAPQDIRWDPWPLDTADHFLWWHVTLTFSHEITTCAEKPGSGKFSRTMIINQVLTWALSHKF